MQSERYKIKITNLKNVSVEDAKFMFEQVEKKLEQSTKISDIITERTYTVLTIVVGLIVGIAGYVITSSYGKDVNSVVKIVLATLFIIGLTVCLYFLIKNVNPTKYYSPGSVPDEICVNDFFIDGFGKEVRSVNIYLSEIENYKVRIDVNTSINEVRKFRLRNCIAAIYWIAISLFILYLLYLFFYRSYIP